jgi:hypothetical protein
MISFSEPELIVEEEVIDHFNVLTQHSPTGTEEKHEKPHSG